MSKLKVEEIKLKEAEIHIFQKFPVAGAGK
jgi:hypothetical protein